MRMFRHCPYEKCGRTNCEGCQLFWKCLAKKLRRKIKKNHLVAKILWVIFIIIMLALVVWWNIEEEKKEERNRLIEQRKDVAVTKEVITKEIKVTTLSSKAKIVEKPTSTPIPTRKPEDKHQYENIVLSTTSTTKAMKMPKIVKAKKAGKVAKAKKISSQKKYGMPPKILKTYASLSAYDQKLMEKMVYAESRGEPYEGKVAVAAVILNRYIFYKKQKSIEELVTEKGQFADISKVTQEDLNKYSDCKKAVKEAIKGNDPTREKFSEGARCFYNPKKVSDYQRKKREGVSVLIIGNHHFHNNFNE